MKTWRRHSVWVIQRPGEPPRTLKIWPAGPWMLVKLMLGIAQPQRHVRGAQRVRNAGVPSPRPIGSWRVRMQGLRPMVELELEYAPGLSAWELIGEAQSSHSTESLLRCARLVGSAVYAMASHGVFHRDLKPSNVVIDGVESNQPTIWIIDTVGVRRMRRRIDEFERMLERLAIQPIQLEGGVARAMRVAAIRSAIGPLSKPDRQAVMKRLRWRANQQPLR